MPRKRARWWTVGTLLVVVALLLLSAATALAFPDVAAKHPYYEAISDMAARGVIGGYKNGNFGPDDPVMRKQFAKMIVGTMGDLAGQSQEDQARRQDGRTH